MEVETMKVDEVEASVVPLVDESNGVTTDATELAEGVTTEEGLISEESAEEIIKYDEDELLVKLVYSYRFLWDPLTKGYKDNDEKKKAWRDISAALNKDIDFLKRRWKNLRDGMMRCLKKENIAYRTNSKVPTCRLYNQLIFLKEFFPGNSDEKVLVSFTNGGDNDNEDAELPDSPGSASSPSQETPQIGRKRLLSSTSDHPQLSKWAKKSDREKLDILLANAVAKLSDQNKDEDNSDWLFCKSLVGLLGKLPPKRNRLARMEIQQVLMRYEFGEDEVEEEES